MRRIGTRYTEKVKHKPWRIIAAFALMGLVIAAAPYGAAAFDDYTKPMTGLRLAFWTLSMILCPPQFLFVLCIDCEVIGMDGFIMYSIIGVLNAALYAVIGAAFVGLRRGLSST